MIHRRIHQLVLAVFAPQACPAGTVLQDTVSPLVAGGQQDHAGPTGGLWSGLAGGSRLRTVLLPPAPAPACDEPPAGDPDLFRWPVSLAEHALATEIIAGTDRTLELLEVTGSTDRAVAVLTEVRADRLVVSA